MNIYNIIVIILFAYLFYKNKTINLTDITLTIVIIQIIVIQYFRYLKTDRMIKKNIYDQFYYDSMLNKKIYEYNTNSYNTFNSSKHSGIHGNDS